MLDKIRQFFGSQSASSEDSIRKVVPEEPVARCSRGRCSKGSVNGFC